MIVQELIALLGFEVDAASMDKATSAFKKFRTLALGISGAFIAVGAGVAAAIKSTADAGDEARDTATRLGVTVEALQELRGAAAASGASNEELSAALQHLSRASAEAAAGTKEKAEAFARAGIKVRDATGKIRPADELLAALADRFDQIPDAARRTQLAFDLMGRSGTRMIPLLLEGAAGIQALREETRATGSVISQDLAEKADELNDSLGLLRLYLTGIVRTIGGAGIPYALDMAKALMAWIKANRALIQSRLKEWIDRIGAVLSGLVTVMGAVIRTFLFFAGAVTNTNGPLAVFVALIGAGVLVNIGRMVSALAAVVGAFGSVRRAVVLAKLAIYAEFAIIGALFIGLSALIYYVADDIRAFFEGQDSIIGRIKKAFVDAPIKASDTWPVILMKAIAQEIAGILDFGILKPLRFAADAMLVLTGNAPVGFQTELAERFGVPTSALRGGGSFSNLGSSEFSPRAMFDALGRDAARMATANAPITVNLSVDASGTKDPQAVGAAAKSGVRQVLPELQREIGHAKLFFRHTSPTGVP